LGGGSAKKRKNFRDTSPGPFASSAKKLPLTAKKREDNEKKKKGGEGMNTITAIGESVYKIKTLREKSTSGNT